MKKFKKFEIKKQKNVVGGDNRMGLGIVDTTWIGSNGEGTDHTDEQTGDTWYD
jgi:hypothetical protein